MAVDSAYKKLRIFVASPSDMAAERTQVALLVDRLNRTVADSLHLVLEVVEWRHIAPGMGRPEGVILEQSPVESWDVFIGILWMRFGMPTGGVDPQTGAKFESGTEEEFKLAYQQRKKTGKPHIMFYRCQRPANVSQIDPDQLSHVNAFFEQFSVDAEYAGLYKSFQTTEEFQQFIQDDLTVFLLKYHDAQNAAPRIPAEPVSHRITFKGKEYIYIPSGPFTMGSQQSYAQKLNEIEKDNNFQLEIPQHQVTLNGYYIARYPVTNAEYRDFLEATNHPIPYRDDDWSKPFNWDQKNRNYPEGKGNHPVVLVSWHDAQAYCNWLGARLPSEAEWEKAARGNDAREWPWGQWQMNYCNTEESGIKGTLPVGQFSPQSDSPYGVGDMAGNVWEWCSSLREPYPYQENDGREVLAIPGKRVLRGGAWGLNRWGARCAFRNAADSEDYGFSIGFRGVLLKNPESSA